MEKIGFCSPDESAQEFKKLALAGKLPEAEALVESLSECFRSRSVAKLRGEGIPGPSEYCLRDICPVTRERVR